MRNQHEAQVEKEENTLKPAPRKRYAIIAASTAGDGHSEML